MRKHIDIMSAHFLCGPESRYDDGRTAFSWVEGRDDVENVHSSGFKVGTGVNRLPLGV